MACQFINDSASLTLNNKKALSDFITQSIANQTGKASSIIYIFVNDDALLIMNKAFLKHDTLTDIIAFDHSESNKKIIGEIYTSIDRVIENARKFKIDVYTELYRVLFHGALHLCGCKDKTKADAKLMREMEDYWLQYWT
jgi:probable rRNA maturation factor